MIKNVRNTVRGHILNMKKKLSEGFMKNNSKKQISENLELKSMETL